MQVSLGGKAVGTEPLAAGRSGSFRSLDGTSGRGKRAAITSRACCTELPDTAASKSSWFSADKCGFNSAATDSESLPAASSGNMAG